MPHMLYDLHNLFGTLNALFMANDSCQGILKSSVPNPTWPSSSLLKGSLLESMVP